MNDGPISSTIDGQNAIITMPDGGRWRFTVVQLRDWVTWLGWLADQIEGKSDTAPPAGTLVERLVARLRDLSRHHEAPYLVCIGGYAPSGVMKVQAHVGAAELGSADGAELGPVVAEARAGVERWLANAVTAQVASGDEAELVFDQAMAAMRKGGGR